MLELQRLTEKRTRWNHSTLAAAADDADDDDYYYKTTSSVRRLIEAVVKSERSTKCHWKLADVSSEQLSNEPRHELRMKVG